MNVSSSSHVKVLPPSKAALFAVLTLVMFNVACFHTHIWSINFCSKWALDLSVFVDFYFYNLEASVNISILRYIFFFNLKVERKFGSLYVSLS